MECDKSFGDFLKKIVIADNCAIYANLVFNDYNNYSGVALFFGATLFAFQIYGDFSGYSDIAIGTSRLFGFNLMQNFNFPYFSRDIAEFWRRWHISLSTWFRDYVYIPLGGSRTSRGKKIINVFIIFLISGFWHGANWTFIAWGAVNALYFLPILLLNRNRINIDSVALDKKIPSFKEFCQIVSTFFLVVIAWIFFRSENITDAFKFIYLMIKGIFSKIGVLQIMEILYFKIGFLFPIIFSLFILVEWNGRQLNYGIEKLLFNKKRVYRFSSYYIIILIILYFLISGEEQEFIYFQF